MDITGIRYFISGIISILSLFILASCAGTSTDAIKVETKNNVKFSRNSN